ncbi:hypothetical protein AVEN_160887-1 [Araneus ventricosus]|uniref:Uncharacterized protein n=1 Tax=Araneus ventricosus TaxID=182803 RepID=A0A4Y1ZSX2_ARAVE|nr:hypothetical protein AVEN_160887-1 [Araneus ventricosus]
MKPRHLNRLAHFGDSPDGSIDVRESVYMHIYKEKIVRKHLTGPQHYLDNGLVSGTRGEVSRNQEEEVYRCLRNTTVSWFVICSERIAFVWKPKYSSRLLSACD